MTFISEENKAIQYYLDRLKDGPVNDKKIQNMINQKFNVSAASIRNKLIEDGVIELKVTGYDNKRLRNIFTVSLADPNKVKFIEEAPKEPVNTGPEYWPGTNIVKSKGDAFDWRNTAKGLFSKAELAAMQTKIKSNPHFTTGGVHVYSRA